MPRSKQPPQLGTDGIGADMWREARVAEYKSHDAALPIPFGRSLEMLGKSAHAFASSHALHRSNARRARAGAAADLVVALIGPRLPSPRKTSPGIFSLQWDPNLCVV